ncbi:MAG: DsrE family protein [Candidatus Heimdallarchaeota archaeon]|nr:DsrE family protein [Candidatus Heimdallarchaeota archaeon]
MTVISILIKSGKFQDFNTLALLTSGFVAADFEVRIFAMDDAVYALKKDQVGKTIKVESDYPEYNEKLETSVKEGKAMSWWDLLADLKEFGDITINVCALVAEVVHLEENDFHELVDNIAGVATFAADVDDSDFVLSL